MPADSNNEDAKADALTPEIGNPTPATTPVEQVEAEGTHDEVREDAAARIQSLFRRRKARRHMKDLLASVFEKYYDESSGQYYYHNKRTGETTWEKPRTLKPSEDIELAPVYARDQEPSSASVADDGTELVDLDVEEEEEGHPDDSDGEPNEGDDGDGEPPEDGDAPQQSGFSAQEIALVREQFDHYDGDKSGSISAKELRKIFTSLGEPVSLASVKEMIREVDANGNGEVEFDEFLDILRRQRGKNQYSVSLELAILFGPKELENLKRQFIRLDLDGSGFIDEHEIQALIKKLGRKVEEFDLEDMLLEVDADGSGTIGFNEFLQIVATMMKGDQNGKRSAFAALLDMGIAQGVLDGLDEVIVKSRQKVYEWWNADAIAEQKRMEIKRERRRKREEERRRQLEKDREVFAAHQAKLAAIEAARKAPIDGLIHEIEFTGDGRTYPVVGQFARVHYVGTFEKTGQVFESTRKRCGTALEFCVGVGHLIKGFDLVLQRMSVGETAKVTMAPMLAYGVKGRPPKIPPNTTLVFKIELISIQEKLNLAQDFDPEQG